MKKKIIIILITLLLLIIAVIIATQKNEDLNILNNNASKISYVYETENGTVEGSFDDWINGEYSDYVLDVENSICNGEKNPSGLIWDDEKHSVILSSKISSKCILYFHEGIKGELLTELIKSLLTNGNETSSGNGYLYLHNSSLTNGAKDDGYRYAGDQPNNYICFGNGSEGYNNGKDSTCPTTNKYRIIGLVPVTTSDGRQETLVKIIKAEYVNATELGIDSTGTVSSRSSYVGLKRIEAAATGLNGFHWNDSPNNTWGTNTLYNALNNESSGYLKFLYGNNETNKQKWESKIETVRWNVGGWSSYSVTPQAMYTAEMTNSGSTGAGTTVDAKVGLMYAHDYGFASKKENWESTLYKYSNDNNRQNNWLFNGVAEWTISRNSADGSHAFYIYTIGYVDHYSIISTQSGGVRPVLYLKTNVKIKTDSTAKGSKEQPYKIV